MDGLPYRVAGYLSCFLDATDLGILTAALRGPWEELRDEQQAQMRAQLVTHSTKASRWCHVWTAGGAARWRFRRVKRSSGTRDPQLMFDEFPGLIAGDRQTVFPAARRYTYPRNEHHHSVRASRLRLLSVGAPCDDASVPFLRMKTIEQERTWRGWPDNFGKPDEPSDWSCESDLSCDWSPSDDDLYEQEKSRDYTCEDRDNLLEINLKRAGELRRHCALRGRRGGTRVWTRRQCRRPRPDSALDFVAGPYGRKN